MSAPGKPKLLDKFNTFGRVSNILDMVIVASYMLTRGEMQLFVIARALMSSSKILVLDEPTRGLNHESDEIVRRFLWERGIATSRTMIIFTNKLQSMIEFNTAVVLSSGRIEEMDKHSKLAETLGSMFARLLSQSPRSKPFFN